MIRVALVEGHPHLRKLLRLLLHLAPDIELVFEAADSAEAIQCVRDFEPDVLVMDLREPASYDLNAAKQIAELSIGTQMILIAFHRGSTVVKRAAEAGASGFLPKDEVGKSLLEAIQSVYHGQTFFVE